MKRTLLMTAPLWLALASPLHAAPNCTFAALTPSDQNPGPWIDRSNWLAPENLRYGLQSASRFMPLVTIKSNAAPLSLKPAPRQLELDKITATDPLDRTPRDLGFLLDTRLYADGFLVLRNGRVQSERYWHGTSPQQPRLLQGASRPLLSLLGAMALAQGKLAGERSVIRYLPALSAQTGLRKLSIQRLIEANGRFEWTPQEIGQWQAASGWQPGTAGSGVRTWLQQPERWERGFAEGEPGPAAAGPEDDLLAWALAESYHSPLAQVFCDQVLARLRPENPAYWLTDAQGNEVADGLALSLRDFARFGQLLVDARNAPNRSKIPGWFIETLSASNTTRRNPSSDLLGLGSGSETRYGFVHLAGGGNRIALLGRYGNSLYIDFDRRLVIAIFAAYPAPSSAALRATLAQVWEQVASASQINSKR